jgi:hypothetical protein
MFGYHLLRQNRSEENAKHAFNILTYYSQRRIEKGMRRKESKNYQG